MNNQKFTNYQRMLKNLFKNSKNITKIQIITKKIMQKFGFVFYVFFLYLKIIFFIINNNNFFFTHFSYIGTFKRGCKIVNNPLFEHNLLQSNIKLEKIEFLDAIRLQH